MNNLIKEFVKSTILCLTVLAALFLLQSLIPPKESVAAKAERIRARKGNIGYELTREERDEYMKYLRVLSGYTFEDGVESIYKLEIP